MSIFNLKKPGLLEDDVLPGSVLWIVKFMLLTGVIATGWITKQLKETCIAIILAFALWQGLLPFRRFATEIRLDRRRCRAIVRALQTTKRNQAEAWNEIVATADMKDQATVVRMYRAITSARGRLTKQAAIDNFLELERQRWEAKLLPVNETCDQVVTAGLIGSLIGITSALTGGMQLDVMISSMSTMTTTTVAGLGASILLGGLAAIGNSSIERHLAELQAIAGMLPDDNFNPNSKPDRDEDGDRPSLFGGKRS